MDFSFSEKNEKEESEDSVQVCILVGFDRATQFIRLKKKKTTEANCKTETQPCPFTKKCDVSADTQAC